MLLAVLQLIHAFFPILLNIYPSHFYSFLTLEIQYRNSYNDLDEIRELKIKLNVYEHWYEGAHEESEEVDAIDAIAFLGDNKNAKD